MCCKFTPSAWASEPQATSLQVWGIRSFRVLHACLTSAGEVDWFLGRRQSQGQQMHVFEDFTTLAPMGYQLQF